MFAPGRGGDGSGSDVLAATSNSTDTEKYYGDSHKLSSGPLDLESGVSVDQGLLRRSPLLRTTAPLWSFLRSRAGELGPPVAALRCRCPLTSLPSVDRSPGPSLLVSSLCFRFFSFVEDFQTRPVCCSNQIAPLTSASLCQEYTGNRAFCPPLLNFCSKVVVCWNGPLGPEPHPFLGFVGIGL